MKKNLFFMTFLIAIFSLVSSCTNLENEIFPDGSIENIVTQGESWKVIYFWDKDKEETHKFRGYSFVFESGGTLQAIKGGAVVKSGTWAVSSSGKKFIINLGTSEPLDELEDDWLIIEKTDTRIKLKDDNDEHLEELHFEKI